MRRAPLALLLFFVAVSLTDSEPRAGAQPKDNVVDETFRTADGVELHGRFSASTKAGVTAGNAPVVVLLYPPGSGNDMTKGDWGTLTKKLNEEGFHVFQFDWRGHGKSTEIKDTERFWIKSPYLNGTAGVAPNTFIKDWMKKPLKDKLTVKDVTNTKMYYPAYAMDLAAVRYQLDTKNDNKELNTSSIYLIGTEEAAGLGLAWITMEWKRPSIKPGDNQLAIAGAAGAARYEFIAQLLRGDYDEAGQDFAGAVWLSAARPPAISEFALKKWASDTAFAPQLRNNTPMLFLHGDKDLTQGKKAADFFYNEVLVASPKKGSPLSPLKQTFVRELKGGGMDRGLKLLGNKEVNAEETILKFMKEVQKDRQRTASKQRGFANYYGVSLKYFGLVP
jgi:pimeloyl-ACP methyl ester carboxylesterase